MIWGWELWDGTRMELKWYHKQKFKVKFICSNQKRRQLMQFETKKVHGWVMPNPTHKTHHDLDLGGVHHFFSLIIYFVINGGDTSRWKKVLGLSKNNFENWYRFS
jgi:hypothetical protein